MMVLGHERGGNKMYSLRFAKRRLVHNNTKLLAALANTAKLKEVQVKLNI